MARFRLVTLAPLPGFHQSQAFGVDALGRAVGVAWFSENGQHAVRWTADGTPIDLDGDPGRWSRALACSSTGVVVGDCGFETPNRRLAFVHAGPGGLRTLPPLPGHTHSWATAIADDGVVGGASSGFGKPVVPVVWDPAGTVRALTVLPGYDAEVFAVRGGWVAGGTRTPDAPAHEEAFVGRIGGPYRRLGSVVPGTTSRALGVTSAGRCVGFGVEPLYGQHAVTFDDPGTTRLGFVGTSPADQASAVDDSGRIVGFAYEPDSRRTVAFLRENGVTQDLNGLVELVATGWHLGEATAIRGASLIAGNGSLYGRPNGFALRA